MNVESNEYTKELGTVWFLCLFVGAFTGGVGLLLTVPFAICWTIYALWKDLKGEKPPTNQSSYYLSSGGGIENLDTMDIPHSGYTAAERAAEYRRRGQSPSAVIDGIYNDMNRPRGVPYNDSNRDWDADA